MIPEPMREQMAQRQEQRTRDTLIRPVVGFVFVDDHDRICPGTFADAPGETGRVACAASAVMAYVQAEVDAGRILPAVLSIVRNDLEQ